MKTNLFSKILFSNVFVLLISACAFSPKFKGPKYDSNSKTLTVDPEKEVILALTNAKLERGKRKGFDQRSQSIYENLENYPGYIGGTVRFEIFGDQVWTMTVWEDKESLDKFVDSTQHLDAMYMTNQAMKSFRHTHIRLKAKELPYSWEQALKLLDTIPITTHKPF